ncbi:hypothetical protein NQ314_012553 [Rhamnusium bicolor]|uniref:Armadillo repeat-containing protein 6 n=1 Tax=Rhamnusium bicolor TaxID=1586634 RepID=A0AAV8XBX6_9CUCU|nr:hypothetical protein NQ314_012553 [Rhamnusium bicolor]
MTLVISQETFNDAVRENIENLELSPEDAIRETVIQFESQGADLSSIVKEPPTYFESVKEQVVQLIELNKSKTTSKDIVEKLEAIKTECDKGIEYKVLLGEFGAYSIILDSLSNYENDDDVRKNCFKTLISLMNKQPDLLDDRGIEVVISHLEKDVDVETRRLTLKWTTVCCTWHELNRQKLFNANILDALKGMLIEGNSEILREALAVCRVLVLDDDVRVEFGKGYQHAKIIANDTLCSIITLLSRFRLEEQLINDLMITLSLLLVRTEFCKKVADAGGLEIIRAIMEIFQPNEKINKQCFKLLKAIAGNDECKIAIIQKNFAPVITAALQLNTRNIPTLAAGLYCVAALTLRCPENSKELFESGIPEVIIDIMKMYPNENIIQKSASWAVRNIVSRNRSQSKAFLELDIEELLLTSLKKFKEIEYDIKAALRDLGCNVQLKEEWTGQGGALTTGVSIYDD